MHELVKDHTCHSDPLISPGGSQPEASLASFAFLNHSQLTIPQNLPPTVDNKPLARQRRRRTSPEDAAILEAEFELDSKPDKLQRSRIAERVALGEKEVQIWFQNRRSTTRRRARPLTPPVNNVNNDHERAAPLTTGHDSRSDIAEENTQSSGSQNSTPLADGSIHPTSRESSTQILDAAEKEDSSASRCMSGQQQEGSSSTFAVPVVINVENVESSSENSGQGDSTTHGDRDSTSQDVSRENAIASRKLQRKPSAVRLSMTSEGVATILGEEDASPSPPKLRAGLEDLALMPRGLRRSYSASGLADTVPYNPVNRKKSAFQRTLSGRSRDSRAWEFWCDNDAGNDLARKAEQEATGSAAGAISLMRSARLMKSNVDNAKDRGSRRSSFKRAKSSATATSRPPLARIPSSSATTQSGSKVITESLKNHPSLKTKEEVKVFESNGGDSDKENREPYPGANEQHRQTMPADNLKQNRRPILTKSRTAPSQASKSDFADSRNRASNILNKSDISQVKRDFIIDDEVARFMNSEHDSSSESRQSDDLVIQGLLSLSQGAWR